MGKVPNFTSDPHFSFSRGVSWHEGRRRARAMCLQRRAPMCRIERPSAAIIMSPRRREGAARNGKEAARSSISDRVRMSETKNPEASRLRISFLSRAFESPSTSVRIASRNAAESRRAWPRRVGGMSRESRCAAGSASRTVSRSGADGLLLISRASPSAKARSCRFPRG